MYRGGNQGGIFAVVANFDFSSHDVDGVEPRKHTCYHLITSTRGQNARKRAKNAPYLLEYALTGDSLRDGSCFPSFTPETGISHRDLASRLSWSHGPAETMLLRFILRVLAVAVIDP